MVGSNWPITDNDGNRKVAQAVIFGLGSMFNHSTQDQNVVWERDPDRLIITYRALRDIQAGEELCKYGNDSITACPDAEARHILWKPPNFQGC